jgi:hypothetical protein
MGRDKPLTGALALVRTSISRWMVARRQSAARTLKVQAVRAIE